MEYFQLLTIGDTSDASLCFIADPPEGMGLDFARLSLGRPAAKIYPQNAEIRLRDQYPGIKLAGFIGNVKRMLIFSRNAKDILERELRETKIEYLPFTLINHKGRVHTTDYFIVNPIGGFECVNEKMSQIKRSRDGSISTMKELILDKKKMDKAPPLFRVKGKPNNYVISRELAKTLADGNVSNLFLKKLKIG